MRWIMASNSKSARVRLSSRKASKPCPLALICADRMRIWSSPMATASLVCCTLPCNRSSIFCTESASFWGFAGSALGRKKPWRVTLFSGTLLLFTNSMGWKGAISAGPVCAAAGALCSLPGAGGAMPANILSARSACKAMLGSAPPGSGGGGPQAGCVEGCGGGVGGGSFAALAARSASFAKASLSKASTGCISAEPAACC
mmetsp:Transcript_51752/g.110685  ORF Transcript_51752/g.110685 Transcript_51752/m.110685 type:complete len:201 (-) Transcript_51752:1043-1645(-)